MFDDCCIMNLTVRDIQNTKGDKKMTYKGTEKQIKYANDIVEAINKQKEEMKNNILASELYTMDYSYKLVAKFLNIEIPSTNLESPRAQSKAIRQGKDIVEEQKQGRGNELIEKIEKSLDRFFEETEEASEIIEEYTKAEKNLENLLLNI